MCGEKKKMLPVRTVLVRKQLGGLMWPWGRLGGCLGSFLFFRGAAHSSRFLSADPLVLPNFLFLFPPRVHTNAYL